jgi:glycerophosphoryl diester phosphodiesterase
MAHRGFDLHGAENTIRAFRAALDLGVRYLETDVHATADGHLVAFHDERLDRVSDGRGLVARTPWRIVRQVRIGGSEPVPLLEELLEELPQARFNIDVKADRPPGQGARAHPSLRPGVHRLLQRCPPPGGAATVAATGRSLPR